MSKRCPECGYIVHKKKEKSREFYQCGNFPMCRHEERVSRVGDELIISMEDYINDKKDALVAIIDLGYDYDGCNEIDSLKELIDELVEIGLSK